MDSSQEGARPSPQDTGAERALAQNGISNLKFDLTKIVQPEYLQKQPPDIPEQFDLSTVINFDALRNLDIDGEEFRAKLDASAEKAKKYIDQRSTGIDGNPLSGEASELSDQSLRAEREALVGTILARMSLGQAVSPKLAIDISMLGAALDTKGDAPRKVFTKEEVSRRYAEILAHSVLQGYGAERFDAWTKINRKGEEYNKINPNDSGQDTAQAQAQIREELKQQNGNTSGEDEVQNQTSTNNPTQ